MYSKESDQSPLYIPGKIQNEWSKRILGKRKKRKEWKNKGEDIECSDLSFQCHWHWPVLSRIHTGEQKGTNMHSGRMHTTAWPTNQNWPNQGLLLKFPLHLVHDCRKRVELCELYGENCDEHRSPFLVLFWPSSSLFAPPFIHAEKKGERKESNHRTMILSSFFIKMGYYPCSSNILILWIVNTMICCGLSTLA